MDTTLSLSQYLTQLSSSSPTPGGGNVSALAGSIACSLGIMVCNLSYGKKKYLAVESELRECSGKLETAFNNFVYLADEDNKAFDLVMDAFRLPKETEEEKVVRLEKISTATLHAAEIPFRVIETCRKALPELLTIMRKGNSNSKSDAGVALLQIQAAAKGAFYNVLINCNSLKDSPEAVKLKEEAISIISEIENTVSAGLKEVEESL